MVDEFDQIRKRGRNRWLAAIVINLLIWGLLALVGYMWFTRTAFIEVQSIVASARYPIKARQDGEIEKINFEETQPFHKGDLLFSVKDEKLLSEIKNTSESISRYDRLIEEEKSDLSRRVRMREIIMNIQSEKQAKDEAVLALQTLESNLRHAEDDIKREEEKYKRAQSLFTSGVLTRTELEEKFLPVLKARAARDKILDDIKLKREQIKGHERKINLLEEQKKDLEASTAETIQQLETKKEAALAALATLMIKKQELNYYAEQDGFVATRIVEKGLVKFGEPILEWTTGEDLWVEAYFPPELERLVHNGDRLEVRYGEQRFQTVVETKSYSAKPWPYPVSKFLAKATHFVIVKLRFVDLQKAKDAGLRPGLEVVTEVSRQEGLLYRLGIKKARSPSSEPSSTDQNAPTTHTAN